MSKFVLIHVNSGRIKEERVDRTSGGGKEKEERLVKEMERERMIEF